MAPQLRAQRDIGHGRGGDGGRFGPGAEPEGILPAFVIDWPRLSPVRVGPDQRGGNGYPVPARQAQEKRTSDRRSAYGCVTSSRFHVKQLTVRAKAKPQSPVLIRSEPKRPRYNASPSPS